MMILYTCSLIHWIKQEKWNGRDLSARALCCRVLHGHSSVHSTLQENSFFHKIHIRCKFMSRDSCDNTIAKFSLLFGKWFFSSKRYTTWADNIFLSRILEEEEEEHLPVVRRDLVLDESVDERADPLFTQALSRSRLAISPTLKYLVLSNLDIERETSFL